MSDETTQTAINPNEAINYTTLSEKLNALNNSRLAIIDTLNENGAEVPTNTKFSKLPEFILNQARYTEPEVILDHQTESVAANISFSGSARLSAVIAENGILKIHYAGQASYNPKHIIWLNNINDSTVSSELLNVVSGGLVSDNIIYPITEINEDVSSHLVLNLDFFTNSMGYCAILAELYK